MARPTKQGIDYFPLDCQFDDDTELFIAENGAEALGILIAIWQVIYKNDGYYAIYDHRFPAKIKQRVLSDIEVIHRVIHKAVEWDIFDQDIFSKHEILTSKGIQKRYLIGSRSKKQVHFYSDIMLIDVSDVGNAHNFAGNPRKHAGNATNVNVKVKVNVKEEVKEEVNVKETSSSSTDKSDARPDDGDDKPKKNRKKSKFKYTVSDMKTAEYIHSRVKIINPDMKPPNLESWANDIRLMRETDKRTVIDIREVFTWANNDDFWQTNIMCTAKLRKQFDALKVKMNARRNGNLLSPPWAKLPADNEQLKTHAERYGLQPPISGDTWHTYRWKLETEIERKLKELRKGTASTSSRPAKQKQEHVH